MKTLFQSLPESEKIDFFVKCQSLLLNHHPKSSFIIRENNLDKALDAFHNNISKYQGYQYVDENICVLWNHIFIEDPKDIKKALTDNAYKAPHPDFNAVSIDFAVFRKMEDCLIFVKKNYQPQIKNILFIRGGNPKIYDADSILKAIKF